jgi:hypothetical protein
MKYRTVEFYPQVDQQLNKAIALIASGQLSAKEAMAQAQAGTIADLKRADFLNTGAGGQQIVLNVRIILTYCTLRLFRAVRVQTACNNYSSGSMELKRWHNAGVSASITPGCWGYRRRLWC